MLQKFEETKKRLAPEHHDLVRYAQHLFDEIDLYVENHNRLKGSNAVAGVVPDPAEERVFLQMVTEFRHLIVDTLEKTTQEFEHKGDKNWRKIYKDGVDE